MKKNLHLLLVFIFVTLTGSTIFGQEETTKGDQSFSVSGSIDTYYKLNLGGEFNDAPATSFANLPGFSLGMANIVAGYEGEKAGFVADLVFGPRGEDATFLSPDLRPGGSSNIINQLYAYLKVSDAVTLTLGNFNTFLGYEVISPASNFNYSTSYMFSYGPFSHSGLKMDADLGGGFSLMLGVFNPTDATEYNPTNDFFGGAQLGYGFDRGSAYLNLLFGEDYFQVDLTAGVDLTEKLYLGVNATSATSDLFAGVAGYLQFQTSDNLKLGVRGEYFADKGVGAITLPDDGFMEENVFDLTFSANVTIGNLTIIPEIRADFLSFDGFDNGTSSSLSQVILAAVYSF